MSSMTARAVWTAVKTRKVRRAPRPIEPRVPVRKPSSRFARANDIIGTRLATTAATRATTAVAQTVERSGSIRSQIGSLNSTSVESAASAAVAIIAPTGTAGAANTRPSIESCRASDLFDAPSARRTAISVRRSSARASRRLPTFAHVNRTIRATASTSTVRYIRASPSVASRSESIVSRTPMLRIRVSPGQETAERIDFRRRLQSSDTWFQPADDRQAPVVVSAVVGNRSEDLSTIREVGAWRRDADDFVPVAIELDRLAHQGRISAKRAAPEAVAQHDVKPALEVGLTRPRGSGHRRSAEHVEQIRGADSGRQRLRRTAACREVVLRGVIRREAIEEPGVPFERPVPHGAPACPDRRRRGSAALRADPRP